MNSLISENDYKAIQNAVEVTTAPKAWGIPMLIQVKQWNRNVYSIKNCGTVEEMRWYLG